MRRTWIFCALALGVASPAAADGRVHVVSEGDTLGALAARYHVSVEALREENGLEGDTIQVGQELRIDQEPVRRYRVVPGDTLRCIARRHRVPVARLREDNPRLRRGVQVGQVLRIRGGVEPRAADAVAATRTVTVEEGDTLSAIASRHGLTLAQVEAANPGLEPDLLLAGTELQLPGVELARHVVARGDTLSRVASRYHVTVADLRGWNPDLRGDTLRLGDELAVGRAARSESVGQAFCGHIVGAVQLDRHDGYVLRNPRRSWATARTVQRIRGAFDAQRRRFPRAARVRVHDLSLPGGGPIDDHRSHQSGRDVDITYYQRRGCTARGGCPLSTVDPSGLDARRQWALLHHWLRRDEAEAIYVDYALQAPLYREARRRGATSSQLEAWFQYPRGRRASGGIIRHFPNHRDHLHVRFRCARGDSRCR